MTPEQARQRAGEIIVGPDDLLDGIASGLITAQREALADADEAFACLRRHVDDLSALVRMLVRHVPDDKQIKGKAVDYLKRHGLNGSLLREGDDSDHRTSIQGNGEREG